MNKTLSRLTLAKTIMSLKSKVQYGFTDRPSTRDKSPPVIFRTFIYQLSNTMNSNLPNTHVLPGTHNVNGLHLVNTNLASRS